MDPNLGIIAKVSSLVEVLRLGRIFELVCQRWAQSPLSALRVDMDVTWSTGDVFVSISTCSVTSTYCVCIHFVACLIHFSQWDVSSDFVSLHQLGKITWELWRGI